MGNHEEDERSTFSTIDVEEVPPTFYPSSEEENEPDNDNQNDNESSTLTSPDNTINILMVGLDNAGKTKLLYTLHRGHVEQTIPTIGFNVETLEYNNNKYEIWDIGGQKTVRVLRNSCMHNKSFVIYVLDVSDETRFEEAQQDLHDVMSNNDVINVGLLVLANKMDLRPEFNVQDVAKHLKLENVKQKWKIHGCSALNDGNKLYAIAELLESFAN